LLASWNAERWKEGEMSKLSKFKGKSFVCHVEIGFRDWEYDVEGDEPSIDYRLHFLDGPFAHFTVDQCLFEDELSQIEELTK
jgi:hypothetical protein